MWYRSQFNNNVNNPSKKILNSFLFVEIPLPCWADSFQIFSSLCVVSCRDPLSHHDQTGLHNPVHPLKLIKFRIRIQIKIKIRLRLFCLRGLTVGGVPMDRSKAVMPIEWQLTFIGQIGQELVHSLTFNPGCQYLECKSLNWSLHSARQCSLIPVEGGVCSDTSNKPSQSQSGLGLE